jgi:hypothetical protein
MAGSQAGDDREARSIDDDTARRADRLRDQPGGAGTRDVRDLLAALQLGIASSRSSPSSTAGRNARYAVAKKTVAVPASSATTISCVMVSQPASRRRCRHAGEDRE